MTTDESPISRFQQMVKADPDNELGHFSLGKAYLEAGRFKDAIESLSRVLELNAKMSKAYQLLGGAFEATGQRDRAIEVVTQGFRAADERGDSVARSAMAEMLGRWGVVEPEAEIGQGVPCDSGQGEIDATISHFRCARCGCPDGRLPEVPFKGPLGVTVQRNTCTACWGEWIAMGTKVINELGLALSGQPGRDTYDKYMAEFLQLERS